MPKNHPELTAERLREVLSYDPATGKFLRKTSAGGVPIGAVAGHLSDQGYQMLRIDGRAYRGHRLAWLYVHGRWPADQLDHINGVRDDNRVENLRESTQAENLQNQGIRASNKAGHPGVFWNAKTGRWWAYININRRRIHLGCFSTKNEAISARVSAKADLHPFNPSDRIIHQESIV